jgi:hypothetical protein
MDRGSDKLMFFSPYPPVQVHYVVSKPSWGGMMWKGGVGYVTKDVIKQHLPAPGLDSLVRVVMRRRGVAFAREEESEEEIIHSPLV